MTRKPVRYDLTITQGEDWSMPLRIKAQNPVTDALYLLDTTNFTSRMTVRDEDWDGDPIITATTENFQIDTGYSPGKVVRNTAYILGQQVIPFTGPNGFIYVCTVAGTTHLSTQPTWPTTINGTVTDGTVTWKCEQPDDGLVNLTVLLSNSATASLTDWGKGVYDLEIIDEFGHVLRIMEGVARLSREATY